MVRVIGEAGAVSALMLWVVVAAGRAEHSTPPFWQVVRMTGQDLPCLKGRSADRVAMIACRDRCAPIPWQLDERHPDGQLALDRGPRPNPERPPNLIDDNDELLWMLDDAGRPMRLDEVPPALACGHEIRLQHRQIERWVYALVLSSEAPHVARRYVEYDPVHDTMTGARISLGFDGPIPEYLSVRRDGHDNHNLLDRLKIRASARFLGLVPLGRDEDDLESEFVAWRAGPIRIIRRQRQWVRLGWGLRTPIFRSATYFYRDFAELPVRLRLNFPPTFFFRGIEVQAFLDFRDLQGWRLLAPGLPAPVMISSLTRATSAQVNRLPGDWIALQGPHVTVVCSVEMSPSLETVRRQLLYRESDSGTEPESVVGEMPGVGYRLTEWDRVDRGRHWFTVRSYALPPAYEVSQFIEQQAVGLVIEPRQFPSGRDATVVP